MRRRLYDIVFALALFALYTSVALILVAIGARVYMSTENTMTRNYDERTSVLYVAQRVRQSDSHGQIRVEQLAGSDALVFSETINGRSYETWLFVSEEHLCELLVAADQEPDIAMGQRIMPIQSMTIDSSRQSEGLLTIQFVLGSGQLTEIDVYIKSSDPELGGSR